MEISLISDVEFQPLTPERWSVLEKLFGLNGACGGGLKSSEHVRQKGEENRKAFKRIVDSGETRRNTLCRW